MTKETKTITGSPPFVSEWGYNLADMTAWTKYPDGEVVNSGYEARKLFYSLSSLQGTYVQSTGYDSAGRMTGRVLGSNVITGSYGYFLWNTPNGGIARRIPLTTGSVSQPKIRERLLRFALQFQQCKKQVIRWATGVQQAL